MVQIINDPFSGNIFGRIGKGVGQGLSEQIPKEVKNYRLSSALEGLQKGDKSLDPIQSMSKLVRGGYSPQEAASLIPFLQEQQQRKASIDEAGLGEDPSPEYSPRGSVTDSPRNNISTDRNPSSQVGTRTTVPTTSQGGKGMQGEIPGEIPQGQDLRGASFLEPISIPQRNAQIARLVLNKRFSNPDKAEAFVDKQDEKRLKGDVAFQEKQDKIKKDLPIEWSKILQKTSILDDLPESLQDNMINRARAEVAEGANPDQVLSKYKQLGFRLAKDAQNLRDMGAESWIGASPSNNRDRLKSLRDGYAEANGLEVFSDNLQSTQDLSTHYARNLAFPLDKKMNNILSKEKPRYGGKGIGSREKESRIANDIGKNITPDQSLFTIGLQAARRGLDDQYIINFIRDNYKDMLNTRQGEELKNYRRPYTTAGDAFLYTMSGLPELKEIP